MHRAISLEYFRIRCKKLNQSVCSRDDRNFLFSDLLCDR